MLSNPDFTWAIIYKVACLPCGVVIAYMGHRLFERGFIAPSDDLDSRYKDFKHAIKSGAPGTFFSVLGALAACVTIFKAMGHAINTYSIGSVLYSATFMFIFRYWLCDILGSYLFYQKIAPNDTEL